VKEETKKLKNNCSIELCGVEPGEIKEFATQGGIVIDKEARARIRDGGLIEVKSEEISEVKAEKPIETKIEKTPIEKKG
jgi:hypothetical protein